MLLLDIGNTNLRWAVHDGAQLGAVQIARHGNAIPLDVLAAWETLPAPTRIVASNVGGAAVAEALGRVTQAYWGLAPEFVSTRAEYAGVRIAYAEPSRFGVDRWLALLAAHVDNPTAAPTLIVDAGTAATFDLLLADGRHLGGLIVPGLEMMRTSLLAGTQIPRIEIEPCGMLWANDTTAAVAAGSVQAIAALAERLAERLAAETGATVRILLTGGDAPRLRAAFSQPFIEIEDLVLRGLTV
ncbi:type III pantothenate kinase [Chromatium okenii]|jgi:type III pantothenate kinase|uniref:Type III pantothenate kinase n=1 Tax=Chromatium okenii TaxID=61644 RepID=A0A2S7XP69_9GAMM|nr:type III pantothenate kinase [Chromatium okenii]MBV5309175.1 type III pantothenate kinase [Chromatium okenii]PQJ95228.1 type III pantothenate kinase [Chromatium okenii]